MATSVGSFSGLNTSFSISSGADDSCAVADIVLEVIENLQEINWGKIVSGVKGFIKSFIENLLKIDRESRRSSLRTEYWMKSLFEDHSRLSWQNNRFRSNPLDGHSAWKIKWSNITL